MIDLEFILPEGWVVLPTTPDTTRVRTWAIEAIIKQYVPDSLPRDRAEPWRRELRKQLQATTDDAEQNGARSVVLPLSGFNGVRIPGSLIIAVLEDPDPQDPERLLASLLEDAGSSGTYLEIGGAPAARVAGVVEHVVFGQAKPGFRVSYYLSHPDVPGMWGLLTFTVMTDGDVEDPAVQGIVELFDAIILTSRWADRMDVPTEDEVLATLGAG